MFGVFDFGFPYFADILEEAPTPPVGDGGLHDVGIGQKVTFSDALELGGGSW